MDVLGENRFRRVVCSKRYCGFSTQTRDPGPDATITKNKAIAAMAIIGKRDLNVFSFEKEAHSMIK